MVRSCRACDPAHCLCVAPSSQAASNEFMLPPVRLRSSRHARALPGMWDARCKARPMKRWLLHLASAVSLLLCLATAVLLVRSMTVSDRWDWSFSSRSQSGDAGTSWTMLSGRGGLGVAHSTVKRRPSAPFPAAPPSRTHHTIARAGYPVWAPTKGTTVNWSGLGCQRLRARFTETNQVARWNVAEDAVAVPLWWLTVLASVLPVGRFVVAIRRIGRRRGGRCLHCGYDLRATPDRCPECGTPVAKATR